ncbi:MAG: thioredoxin domain-containing protein [Actinomycetota bacterium]|nr:thioredoxin domain-containing protein [Actinomycetota bacterium]
MTDTQTDGRDHTLGPVDAPVTLVEYGDYQCPYCAKARPVLEELIEKADGKARLVFRHYPLDSVHPLARRAAEAAEAAGAQGRFWPMHGLLYENQEDLTDEDLRSYAVRLELDLARFDEDLAENRHAGRVQENRLTGEQDGVRGTPGVFLNGVPYGGRLEIEALLEAVEETASGTDGGSGVPVRRVGPESLFDRFEDPIGEICSEERGVNNKTLKRIVELAVEIAREGREGRKIGTLFAVGDHEEVLVRSRPLILDPLAGHADERKHVKDPDMRETIKELAQLDGAFVVADEGVVVSAARYLDAASDNLDLPLGLGSRHMAAASISRQTGAVAVAVSESSMVRVFDEGKVVAEIVPEVWMLRGYGPYPRP